MDGDWQRRAGIVLVIVAALLFNFPLLAVADGLRHCCGIGFLPVYIFVSWGAIIIAAAVVSARGRHR